MILYQPLLMKSRIQDPDTSFVWSTTVLLFRNIKVLNGDSAFCGTFSSSTTFPTLRDPLLKEIVQFNINEAVYEIHKN